MKTLNIETTIELYYIDKLANTIIRWKQYRSWIFPLNFGVKHILPKHIWDQTEKLVCKHKDGAQ